MKTNIEIPKMIKINRNLNYAKPIRDIEEKTEKQVLNLKGMIKSNDRIAIAVGSRGIRNIDLIVRSIVKTIRRLGGNPFIVPAMGSHGHATAKGQREVLYKYGIREDLIGATIISSMDTVELPNQGVKNKVYMDKNAYNADGTIIVNRIDRHPDFNGCIESGLCKMMVIGLGKHRQAIEIHKHGIDGLKKLIVPTAENILKYGNIIMGIGIVENAEKETIIVEGILPPNIIHREKELLKIAKNNKPKLPVENIDILIVDEMGKNICGSGMDTKIIGRRKIMGAEEYSIPDIKNIIVENLSAECGGNALGVGLADFITKKLFKQIDFDATYENVITSNFLERGKIPIIAANTRQAVEWALRCCGGLFYDKDVKAIRILNTSHLNEMYISYAVWKEIKEINDIIKIRGFHDIFDERGYLKEF